MSTLSNPHIHVGTTSIPPSTISHHSSASVAESNNDPSSLSLRARLLVTQQKQVESSNSAKQQLGTLQKQADALLKRLAKHTNWQDQALTQRVADQITELTSNADYQGAIALLKAWLSYLRPIALQHDCMPVSRMVPYSEAAPVRPFLGLALRLGQRAQRKRHEIIRCYLTANSTSFCWSANIILPTTSSMVL